MFTRKQEYEAPCQDSIESAIEESGILDGFANHGCVWEIAPECPDESWRRIDAEGAKSLGNQNLGDRKTGPAAQIQNGGSDR